jgi:hypothetical protein
MNRFSMTAVLVFGAVSVCLASPQVDLAVQKAKDNSEALKGKYIEVHYDFKSLTFHPKEKAFIGDDGKTYINVDNVIINNEPAKSPVEYVDRYDLPCQVVDKPVTFIEFGEKKFFELSGQNGNVTKIVYNGEMSLVHTTSISKESRVATVHEDIEPGEANFPKHFSLPEYFGGCINLIGSDNLVPKIEDDKLVSLSQSKDDKGLEVKLEDATQGTIAEYSYPMSTSQRTEKYEGFVVIDNLSVPSKWTVSEFDKNGQPVFVQSYSNITYRILDAPESPDVFALTPTEGSKPLHGVHKPLLPSTK